MVSPGINPVRERHWICARRMRERRLAQGLTQREVAARLERRGVHTTNRALSAMENGRGLDLGLLPDLAEALDCTVTYLIGLSSDPQAWRPDRVPRGREHNDGLALVRPLPEDTQSHTATAGTRQRGTPPTTSDGGEPGLSANN